MMMRPAIMDQGERVFEAARAAHVDSEAAAEGAVYGPELLRHPPSAWRRLMRSDPAYRSFGTLRYLLQCARDRFESQPSLAHEITSAVLVFVDQAHGPSRIHEVGFRALARKEHANALQCVGDLREALTFAEQAVQIYGECASLHFDQTKARLVVCNLQRELGNTSLALEIARDCAEVFLEYGHHMCRTMARMCEGHVLFTERRFAEALALYVHVTEQAERTGDIVTLARCLQNAAECARELGDIEAARDLYPRALAHFEQLDLPTEATRVRWGYGLSLAAEGRANEAVSELFKVRALYLALGMNTHAASAGLDAVRIRFERGEDVRSLCTEFVRVFSEAGLVQNAIEALAYLREQAKQGTISTKKITHVRNYFGELASRPALLFAPPRMEEEG